MPHYGIFVMIGGGVKLSDHIYSAPSQIVPHYGVLVRNGDGGYSLSDHFYSAPSRNYAPLWYICHNGGGGIKLSGPFAKLCPIMVYLS